MRQLKKLDTVKSISKGRLVFEEDWSDKFNRLIVYFISAVFITMPAILFFKENFISQNDKFILHCVFPISILFGLYLAYRNATEKYLIRINSLLDRQAIRKLLIDYAEKNQFEIYRKSNDCLIFNEAYDMWSSNLKKTRIFFVQDKMILFAVIKDGFRLDVPTLFTHLFLKRDMIKILNQANT